LESLLVLAPNWLGDAVMALPAIADVRRAFPSARLVVAARKAVADLFRLVPGVDDVITLQWSGRLWQRRAFVADAARLAQMNAGAAILFPNSFAAAWLVTRAGVSERWGYGADMRTRLLSRAIARPRGSRHQAAYYQHLTRELGIEGGPLEPVLVVPERAAAEARALLAGRGWDTVRPLAVFAPGAAYGTAKRWHLPYVAQVAADLVRQRNVACVFVGGPGDMAAVREVVGLAERGAAPHFIDLCGQTSIEMLAAVMQSASICVANDSGAMHMAAAIGTPVVALFGPTREWETAPLTRPGGRAEVLTNPVFCRPCMLRECPIDHRCMTGLTPDRAYAAVASLLSSTP
jgi:heptosyltransferase-2